MPWSSGDSLNSYNLNWKWGGPIVSVLDPAYSADSSGAADSTASIEAAAAAVSVGGTLYFPPGVYRIDSTCDIRRGSIRIDGGSRATLKVGSGTAGQLQIGSAGTYLSDVYVCGLNIDGSTGSGYGISSWISQNATFERIQVYDVYDAGFVMSGASTWETNIFVRDISVISTGGDGIRCNGNVQHAVVRDCFVKDTNQLALGAAIASYATEIAVVNTRVVGARDNGIRMTGVRCTAVNCVVTEWATDAYRIAADHCQVTSSSAYSSRDTSGAKHCIRIESGDFARVTGNECRLGMNGVRIASGHSHIITNNQISNQLSDGINASDCTAVLINGNSIFSCVRDGIRASSGSCARFVVTSNIAGSCGSTGIRQASGASWLIANNMCLDNAWSDITYTAAAGIASNVTMLP